MAKWEFYTARDIKPEGWLKRQLLLQANGLAGNLDKVWRDVRDSSWIGGDAEGWERVPYWIDGFTTLATLLDDEKMLERVKKYVDAIINQQKPDGWICPCSDEQRTTYDTWAVILITKVLTTYYECTLDQRIPEVIYNALKNYYELLKDNKIQMFRWNKARWFECFIAIKFTLDRFNEPWLYDLAKLLKEKGTDYPSLKDLWVRPINRWELTTHIVNIAMMLKYESVSCDILGDEYKDMATELYDYLYKYNGTVFGGFTGDECLSGLSAIQGTELCAIVEQMYSYEHLFNHTGDNKWAELLELMAFNALPATISDDMWSHQYDQMANQISCQRFPETRDTGKPIFRTNGFEAHIFGLEPHFGCCTANHGQGWPKLTISAFMHKDDTVINVLPIPCVLNEAKCNIKIETDYPFENSFKYIIKAKEDFKFIIRVNSFSKNLTLNNKKMPIKDIELNFKKGEEVTLNIKFDTKPEFVKRPHGLNSIKCGSIIYALPIQYKENMLEYVRDGVERKFPYCDYELIPESDWNYAFLNKKVNFIKNKTNEIPFSSLNPPSVLKVNMQKIDWGFEDGYDTVCAKIPESTKAIGEIEEKILYPYGCAKLRVTEIPFVKK